MHSDKICKMQYKFTEIESIPKVYQAKNPDAKFAAKNLLTVVSWHQRFRKI